MRLIKMTGGLGNQMFIYALYLNMKRLYPDTRIDLSDMMHYHAHHGYELHRVFRLPRTEFCINQKLKKVLEFLFFNTVLERKQDLTTLSAWTCPRRWPLTYFKGFYQSERFFAEVSEEVRRTFRFDLSLASEASMEMRARLAADPRAVGLHVRRGDYLEPKHFASVGCVCGLPYYRNAIAEITRRVGRPHFYVFSDDPAWARENLPLEQATFIDWNRGKDSWQDMMLMSCCRHNIICNSTFSWWGAWLNPNADKVVVCPERWFENSETPYIYPPIWTKVPVK